MEGPKCLHCHQPLDQDFGISTCAHCGSMMMIDMEGQVHRAQGSVNFGSNPISDNHMSPVEQSDVNEGQNSPVGFSDPALEQVSEEIGQIKDEPLDINTEAQDASELNLEELQSTTSSDSSPAASEGYNWFDQQLDQQESNGAAETAAEAFADIASFGNQDQEIDALQFDVFLSGIDHKDLAAEVHKVLSDNRLFLGSKELLPVNGTLILSGISAARANLIVTRLKHLKIQISWSQKIYEN